MPRSAGLATTPSPNSCQADFGCLLVFLSCSSICRNSRIPCAKHCGLVAGIDLVPAKGYPEFMVRRDQEPEGMGGSAITARLTMNEWTFSTTNGKGNERAVFDALSMHGHSAPPLVVANSFKGHGINLLSPHVRTSGQSEEASSHLSHSAARHRLRECGGKSLPALTIIIVKAILSSCSTSKSSMIRRPRRWPWNPCEVDSFPNWPRPLRRRRWPRESV